MILSAYVKLREPDNGSVIIDSGDTDMHVQAAYVEQDLLGALLIKQEHSG